MPEQRIHIVVDESGARTVQRNLADIGTTAQTSAIGVQYLKRALTLLAGGAVFYSMTRTVVDFGQAMSGLRAVSTATESDLLRLRDASKEFGVSTSFSAAEVARGFMTMTRAGFSVNEQLAAMSNVADLATASNRQLSDAAQITSITLRSFRLGMGEASRVADIFARASGMTTADLGMLAQAMRFVGPAAAGFKVSLENVAAAMTVLSETGLGARQAGGGFRQIISDLEQPTARMLQVFRNLGISTNSVKISQVGLVGALKQLRAAGVDTVRSMELFGDVNGQVLDTLLRSIPELERLTAAYDNSGGYAKRVAKIMKDNLGGALKDVRSAVENLMISFYEMRSTSVLTTLINDLTSAILWLSENLEILDGALVTLAIIYAPKAYAALNSLVVLVSSSWLIAIALAIGALVAFRDKIKMSADSSTTLGDYMSAAFERIKTGGETMLEFFKGRFAGVTDIFDDINFSVEGMVRFTGRALDWWIGLWRAAINVVEEFFINLGPAIKELLIDALNGVIDTLDAGLRRFYAALGKIPGRVGEPYRRLAEEGVIPNLAQTAEGATERLANAVKDGWNKGFSDIHVFEDATNEMLSRADEIARERLAKQAREQATGGLPTTVGGAAPTPEETPLQKLDQLQAGVNSGLGKIGQTITQFGSQVETTLVNAFSGAEDALVSFVTTGKVNFKSLVDSILGDLTRLLFRMALSGILNSLMPGGGGGGGGGLVPGAGRAAGGPVVPGAYYPVGEHGREYFTPTVPGQIVSNDRIPPIPGGGKAEQQPIQVTILQVASKEEALAALRSREGQTIIANTKGGI